MAACDTEALANALITQAETLFDIHDSPSKVIGEMDLRLNELHEHFDLRPGIKFDIESMSRLFLYKELAKFSQKKTAKRVKKWPYLQIRFGLEGVPTQQAISHTRRNRFGLDYYRFLKQVASGIREAARERDIHSKVINTPDATPEEVSESSLPIQHYVDDHAPEIFSTMIDQVCPAFDTGRANNRVHEDERVWEHQFATSLMNDGGTGAAYRSFNKFRANALHNDTHVRAIKQLGTPSNFQLTLEDFDQWDGEGGPPVWRQIVDTINNQFQQAVENTIDVIEPTDLFTGSKTAAIDITEVSVEFELWKDEEDIEPGDRQVEVDEETGEIRVPRDDIPELLRGSKGEDDYGLEFHYATLTIIANHTPIILAVEPIRHNSFWEEDGETVSYAEVVDRLMTRATQLVDIDLVMADRGFDGHAVYHVLDQYHDVDYLIPKKKDSEQIKEDYARVTDDSEIKSSVVTQSLHLRNDVPYIDRDEDPTVGGEEGKYHSHDLEFAYVPATNEAWAAFEIEDVSHAVFATNRDIGPMLAKELSDGYSHRWDIENQYKQVKPLLPSIASKDDRVRYFSFLFSCLLYNLWKITDHSLKILVAEKYDDYGRATSDDRLPPLFPLDDFLMSSIVLLFSDGLDPPN